MALEKKERFVTRNPFEQAATDEYIEREDAQFDAAAALLLRGLDSGTAGGLLAAAASSLRLGELN